MSVRIKSTRNSETWWMWRTNPSFFRTKIQANTVKSMAVLRDSISNIHHWTVFLCNSSVSSLPEAANSNAITVGRIEKKKERIQGFRTGSGEKEEDYRSNPKFKPRNQRNRIKIQGFRRFRLKSPDWTQVTHELNLILLKKTSQVRKQRESMGDSSCLVRNPNPNIKTVWKRKESLQDSQRVWIGVIPC